VQLERIVDPDWVVLNRSHGRKLLHRDDLDRLRGRYGSTLAGVIPLRAEVEAAQAAGRRVVRTQRGGRSRGRHLGPLEGGVTSWR
jgi:hypothetical protein